MKPGDFGQKVHRRIEFRPATNPANGFQNGALPISNGKVALKSDSIKKPDDQVSGPLPGLFDPAVVSKYMHWETVSRAGPGLFNNGNTCFLNSTLQCLLHTPAFTQVLLKDSKTALKGLEREDNQQKTVIQLYQRLVMDVWAPTAPAKSISPRSMVQNIRRVGKQFRTMRQEDAHEYLRQLLDCMHEEILKANNVKISDGKIAETTLISRAFGGYLCNELKCPKCAYSSKSFNHFQDLSLEVSGGISSVPGALKAFVQSEELTDGNEWKCDGCKKKVHASKQLTIHKTPNVLVIHLKRFSYGGVSGKISKNVTFDFSMSVPCTGSPGVTEKVPYSLIGIVVHHGSSIHSGHYVAFVKAPNGQWHEMNDSTVTMVSPQHVLKQQAYILFYSKVQTVSLNGSSTRHNDADGTHEGRVHVNGIRSSNNSSDDLGEAVSAEERSVLQAGAASKVLPTARSSSSMTEVECNNTDKGEQEMEEVDMSMRYVDRETRLKRKYSWAVKPFRFLGNSERLLKWSGRRKKKLRESSGERDTDQPVSALQSFAAWGKAVDLGEQKKQSLGADGSAVAILKQSSDGSTESDDTEDEDEDEESESDEDEDESESEESDKNENKSLGEGSTMKKSTAARYQPDTVILGSGSTRPAPSSMSSLKAVDGVTARQPSIVRGLFAQAKRGKEVGAEGTWEDATEEQIADMKNAAIVSRKIEQKVLADRQSSEWDKALDKGRVKKTMKDKEEKALLAASSVNAFQAVQNERGDKKEYSHSSYQNKWEKDGDGEQRSRRNEDEDYHSGERTNEDEAAGRARGGGRGGGDRGGRSRGGGRGRGRDNGGRGGRGDSGGRSFRGGRDGGRGGGRGSFRGRGGGGGGGGGRGGGGGGRGYGRSRG